MFKFLRFEGKSLKKFFLWRTRITVEHLHLVGQALGILNALRMKDKNWCTTLVLQKRSSGTSCKTSGLVVGHEIHGIEVVSVESETL